MGDFKFDYGEGPLKQAQEQLGLIDLVNRVKAAPTEQALKEQELALKSNAVQQMALDNAINGMKFISQKNTEMREQSKYFDEQMKVVQDNFQQNYDLGVYALSKKFPGSVAVKNEDNTISITDDNGKVYTIDPKGIADPEKKMNISRINRNDWVSSAQDYTTKSQAYNNIINSISQATGAGDLVASYNFIKLIEPGIASTVREGELITLKSTNPIAQNFIQDYNNIVQGKKTLYGTEPNSPQRKQLLQQAKSVFEPLRQQIEDKAHFYHDFAQRNRLDPKDILQPVGDLNQEYLMSLGQRQAPSQKQNIVPQGTTPRPNPLSNKKAKEAGFIPSQSQGDQNTAPPPTLEELTEAWKANTFKGKQ